jgi:hypothetical protein
MHASRPAPSSAEVTTEVTGLLVGLGVLTTALFPFALPALLLALPLVLPVAPLALGAAALWLLVRLLILPLRLAGVLVRGGRRPPTAPDSSETTAALAANARP